MEVVGDSSGEVSRHLGRLVQTGLVAVFDGRHYLSGMGMRRETNISRVLPLVTRRAATGLTWTVGTWSVSSTTTTAWNT